LNSFIFQDKVANALAAVLYIHNKKEKRTEKKGKRKEKEDRQNINDQTFYTVFKIKGIYLIESRIKALPSSRHWYSLAH